MLQLLIVDDHKWTREGLLKTVDWSGLGIEVCAVCENGAQAYVTLQKMPVDIILTDIRMPGMDGIALAEIVHNNYPKIALVLMSAYQEFDYAYKAVNLGVCAYLLKPVDPDDLKKAFSAITRQISATHETVSQLKSGFIQAKTSEVQKKTSLSKAEDTTGCQQRIIVQDTKNYIARNISQKSLNLKQTADDLHINYYYLSKCFKEDEKRTFTEYLSYTRLNIAQSLLSSTNLHIYEICNQIGMEPKNFHLLFHKEFKMSPKEYRNSINRTETSTS